MDVKFAALQRWPGAPNGERKGSLFKSSLSQTMELLRHEVMQLEASDVVIEVDVEPRELRRDGQLKAGARVRGPGVIVSMASPKGSLSFPCDTYTNWEDNLRAIAKALEALRAVDRYGVTRNAEQYRGWAALPDKRPSTETITGERAAIQWLVDQGVISQGHTYQPEILRRLAILKLHPDKCGGDDAKWRQWLCVAAVLEIPV